MRHILIFLLLIVSHRTEAQQDTLKFKQRTVLLSEQAINVLKQKFGDWGLCGSCVFQYNDRGFRIAKEYADLIAGDFNGDGKKDFAALIKTTTKGYLVAIFATKSSYRLHVIDSSGCTPETIIDLVPKGTTEYELTTHKPYTHRTEAIGFGYYEKSGGTYYYQKGRFLYLSTSD